MHGPCLQPAVEFKYGKWLPKSFKDGRLVADLDPPPPATPRRAGATTPKRGTQQ